MTQVLQTANLNRSCLIPSYLYTQTHIYFLSNRYSPHQTNTPRVNPSLIMFLHSLLLRIVFGSAISRFQKRMVSLLKLVCKTLKKKLYKKKLLILSFLGPRFVLNPIKVFDGSFGGETLWENSNYVTPNTVINCLLILKKLKKL